MIKTINIQVNGIKVGSVERNLNLPLSTKDADEIMKASFVKDSINNRRLVKTIAFPTLNLINFVVN